MAYSRDSGTGRAVEPSGITCPVCAMPPGRSDRGKILYAHYREFSDTDELARHLAQVPPFVPPKEGYRYEDWLQGVLAWHRHDRAVREEWGKRGIPTRPTPRSLWGEHMRDLEAQGMMTPGNVERLAQEHFGENLPGYLTVILRNWRRAIADEAAVNPPEETWHDLL